MLMPHNRVEGNLDKGTSSLLFLFWNLWPVGIKKAAELMVLVADNMSTLI
jgi:hypothetical protein